jgi:hypothetical protein
MHQQRGSLAAIGVAHRAIDIRITRTAVERFFRAEITGPNGLLGDVGSATDLPTRANNTRSPRARSI